MSSAEFCVLLLFISANENPFKGNLTSLPKPGGGEFGKFYSLPSLNDPRIGNLLTWVTWFCSWFESCYLLNVMES